MAESLSGPRVRVEGMDETRKVLRAAGGKELQKQLGEVHKDIGRMVIRQAGGAKTGVGQGAGSTLRPSAAAREVVIRMGGKHRDDRREQWGKQQIWPPPERPHVIKAAEDITGEIEKAYLDGVEQIFRRLPN